MLFEGDVHGWCNRGDLFFFLHYFFSKQSGFLCPGGGTWLTELLLGVAGELEKHNIFLNGLRFLEDAMLEEKDYYFF